MNNHNHRKLINSIEECIEYNNTNYILLNLNDWYLVKQEHHTVLHTANSLVYHRKCPMDLLKAPFLHWRILKCQGCGQLPPEGMAAAYALHNMDYIQQDVHNDN